MSRWVRLTTLKELPENKLILLDIEGNALVAVRQGDRVIVFEDRCSHMEYPLHDGTLENHTLTCAYHGARFNIISGEALAMPAFEPIRTYPTRMEGQDIWVDLEPDEN